ncbi:phage terminase small subunit P27 family [Sinorhizobium medicae]|uniref:phage terminase small subunit P27 family n=1 Tax=Sinorhizobium medicae TaxID=110321 RepID=UPI000FDB3516|nr:phage terminase small subunit P27 family [Sinorhizobium medicae]MDX0605407.1 phage terminase small subunit P27 family [Sinorhizobium medicae]MDX0760329.1 phage terminase small subunit P27 family [Sinorhizobium medicae]MDX0766442.1 phage terminase small subunit P27 family [Sinorhizobium medicae]MDX0797036.1 phage terminase small subunit P27 family [Sinorhizobium medicae]MDX0821662.1 phage terminase small subunit P27 family [Sinorhizobium medicae]
MTHLRGVKPSLAPDRAPLTKAPPAPKWMTDEARAEWKRIMPRLIEDRIITRADLTGVENYCVAVGRVREIEALFRTSGLDKVLFGMQNRAMQTARQLAAEYGLSPVSRARVGSASTDEDDDDNPLLIGRNRAHA